MDSLILAINPGSSSIKAALYDSNSGFERPTQTWSESVSTSSGFQNCLDTILRSSAAQGRIAGVGCRVVDGGPELWKSVKVDDAVLGRLTQAGEMAPLHSHESLAAITTVRKLMADIPIVAVFDTTFHRTIPEAASTYALPLALTRAQKIKRYGFHGLVYQSVVRSFKEIGPLPTRLIACQLGSGSSACAILDGISVDTTMGFTPLEGFVMGTRSGSLDPGILLHLMHQGYDRERLVRLLNRESGLLGLSGKTSDMKQLEKLCGEGDEGAQLAFEVFCGSAAKQIASQAVALGGLDALSFSGGIGEHSARVRQSICERLRFLGVNLDLDTNRAPTAVPANLAIQGSKAVWVVPASEEREIGLETARIIRADDV